MATPHAPTGVRLVQRQPLGGLESFKQGWFEIQDEGSQLIAPLLAPRPGALVVDLCAGGGGKTLHLAALMQNRGSIWAADLSGQRLARLQTPAHAIDQGRAVGQPQLHLLHLQQGGCTHAFRRVLSASLRPSPSKLSASTLSMMARPGTMTR